MDTMELDTKKMDVVREILDINDEKLLSSILAGIREAREEIKLQTDFIPPEGFITGDEFERRVKERVTQFYKENGLL